MKTLKNTLTKNPSILIFEYNSNWNSSLTFFQIYFFNSYTFSFVTRLRPGIEMSLTCVSRSTIDSIHITQPINFDEDILPEVVFSSGLKGEGG